MTLALRRPRRWPGRLIAVACAVGVFALGLPAPAPAEQVVYYHVDTVGSVRAVTDSAGAVIERHDFYAFGEECTTAPCNAPGPAQPLHFSGKERDKETGFDYFGARYYGSKVGRFTTVDPRLNLQTHLIDPQRWNRYAYAKNNPYKFVDPDGREPFTAAFIVGAIVLGVLLVLNNPTNAGLENGPTNDTIVDNSYLVGGVTAVSRGGLRALGEVATDIAEDQFQDAVFGGVPIPVRKLKRIHPNKGVKPLPGLDDTGKVHGPLPGLNDLGDYSPDELRTLQDQLRRSVQERIRRTAELGSDAGHAARQTQEQDLIRQIEKHLDGQ